MKDLSDEEMIEQWKRNPYFQYFCGFNEFQIAYPCHPADLVYFRKRIGTQGVEQIFSMSISLHRIAKEEEIQPRRTYVKEIKGHRISLRFFRHPKKIKKARAAMKRLKTIVGILIRDISRNLTQEQLAKHKEAFDLFTKVINQKQKDFNKGYSCHPQTNTEPNLS